MKKLHILIYILIIAIPFINHTEFIEIIAEDGTVLHVSKSETVQNFFNKCREDKHCTAPYKNLFLDFNGKLIREESYEANHTLYFHSSLFSPNKAIVATLKYPQQKFDCASLYQHQENTLIDIQAPSGRIKRCSLNETPAYFFRKCRNSGDCRDIAAMTLKFGNFEIKEDSEIANRPFSSFDTNSRFAQVKKR